MPRRPAKVTQADVARALRAVKATGGGMAVEIKPDGTILIRPIEESPTDRKRRVEYHRELVL